MYIHLRVLSSYSLLKSTLTMKDIVTLCLRNEMPACGIADIDNMFGALEFTEELSKKGIQPIIGCDISIKYDANHSTAPLLLIATSEVGYRNLCKISSKMFLLKKENKTLSLIDIEPFVTGLIALTGGQEGFLHSAIRDKVEVIPRLQELFYNHLYIELQRDSNTDYTKEQVILNIAITENIPIVATNNVCFSDPELFCIS